MHCDPELTDGAASGELGRKRFPQRRFLELGHTPKGKDGVRPDLEAGSL